MKIEPQIPQQSHIFPYVPQSLGKIAELGQKRPLEDKLVFESVTKRPKLSQDDTTNSD